MIEFIFTVDYEIYGNGEGSLRELVYEPMEKLRSVFAKWDVPLVAFIEAAELEMIERHNADIAINDVRRQIRNLFSDGHEIGLHLHPQWCNGQYINKKWDLDYSEYNLCILPRERISEIVGRSIKYLRDVLGSPDFTPLSFRAGNWLFQPTEVISDVLKKKGIKIDSSVFKGGLQRKHNLDYRDTLGNGFYWQFSRDVTEPDADGAMLEIPIYTEMVPFWKMAKAKRIGLQRKNLSAATTGRFDHFLDYLRPMYPLKLDFCRMAKDEFMSMIERVIEYGSHSGAYMPVVIIGHTKDLIDTDSVDAFLRYIMDRDIPIGTFKTAFPICSTFMTKANSAQMTA